MTKIGQAFQSMIRKQENTASKSSSLNTKGSIAEKFISNLRKATKDSNVASQKSELATSSNKENKEANELVNTQLQSVQENENEIANITIADSYTKS